MIWRQLHAACQAASSPAAARTLARRMDVSAGNSRGGKRLVSRLAALGSRCGPHQSRARCPGERGSRVEPGFERIHEEKGERAMERTVKPPNRVYLIHEPPAKCSAVMTVVRI